NPNDLLFAVALALHIHFSLASMLREKSLSQWPCFWGKGHLDQPGFGLDACYGLFKFRALHTLFGLPRDDRQSSLVGG
ncbi:MAG: hypothetical protein QF921_01950, partial [Pseudomonadales bacterium]|nr:hypothetical protein [Pseudomonadales bacterium]